MAKRNPEPEGTRESIRQAAAYLFTSAGVYATSLSDIATKAKLSKGTLYYHYPTKEDLVMDIAEEYFAHMTEIIYGWIDGLGLDTSAEEAIRTLCGLLWQEEYAMKLYFALMSEGLREENALRALVCKKQKEWMVMLEVGALKLSGAGAERFRTHSGSYLALLDGFAMHRMLNREMDQERLFQFLTEG